jgi:hypothetical protein
LKNKGRAKNPAAVALGKLGAKKGGRARALMLTGEERQEIASKGGKARHKSMTPEERSASARKAAQARWRKKK